MLSHLQINYPFDFHILTITFFVESSNLVLFLYLSGTFWYHSFSNFCLPFLLILIFCHPYYGFSHSVLLSHTGFLIVFSYHFRVSVFVIPSAWNTLPPATHLTCSHISFTFKYPFLIEAFPDLQCKIGTTLFHSILDLPSLLYFNS